MAVDDQNWEHLLLWSKNNSVRNSVNAAIGWLDEDFELEATITPAEAIIYNNASASAGRIRTDYTNFVIQLWIDVFQDSDLFKTMDFRIIEDSSLKSIWEDEYFGCTKYLDNNKDYYLSTFCVFHKAGCYVSLAIWDDGVCCSFQKCSEVTLHNKWKYDQKDEEFRTDYIGFDDLINDYEKFVTSVKQDLDSIYRVMELLR